MKLTEEIDKITVIAKDGKLTYKLPQGWDGTKYELWKMRNAKALLRIKLLSKKKKVEIV